MSDHDLELVDYAKVAAHIRALEPRALTPAQLEDVLTIVEWMQAEIVARDEELNRREIAVRERELAADAREKENNLRARALGIAGHMRRPRRRILGNLLG